MGQTLAKYLAGHTELLLYDIETAKARELAEQTGGQAVSLEELASAEIIILALPAAVMAAAAENLKNLLSPRNLIINIATTCPKDTIIGVLGRAEQVLSAKFVGHAKEMAAGEKPTIVIDAANEAAARKAAELFGMIGTVLFGPEDIVNKLNVLAATEGIRAALRIKSEMEKQGLPAELYPAAVRGVAAGTMKGYASGDMGPFVAELVKKLAAEQNN